MKRQRIPFPPTFSDFDVLVNESGGSPRVTVHNLGPMNSNEKITKTACSIRIGNLDWPSRTSIISWRLLELKMVTPCRNCWVWRASE